MVTNTPKRNVYETKMMVNSLLSSELASSNFNISASYEWRDKYHIMSFRVRENKYIDLVINLNIYKQLLYALSGIEELCVKFNAYFIATYIRCLENIDQNEPQSYFNGMVLLCSMNSLYGNRTRDVFSPIERSRVKELRPIDVYCAIRALAKTIIEFGDSLPTDVKENCNETLNKLIIYSIMPEVGYHKQKTVYSLFFEMNEYLGILAKNSDIDENANFFRNVRFDNCSAIDLSKLDADNQFWLEAGLRFLTRLDKNKRIAILKNRLWERAITSYRENCLKYSREALTTNDILLRDNYSAIKKLSKKINILQLGNVVNGGTLHYFD